MLPFHRLFPQQAKDECRTLSPVHHQVLPPHTFLLVEFYCVEPHCDCRRVLLNVMDVDDRKQVATISYGFDPPKPPVDDEEQAFLDPLNPQSRMSEPLLSLFQEMLELDPAYQRRLVRHYSMWKRVVDDPSHPAQRMISADARSPLPQAPRRTRRQGSKIRPNAPCPCGSGRKYKHCCRDS